MGEFEGYGCSAEIFVGVGAVVLGGVDDGEGVGDAEGFVGEMVVGDDEVEAEGCGFVAAAKARMPVSTEMTRRIPEAAAPARIPVCMP